MAGSYSVATDFTSKDSVSRSFRDMDRGAARFGRTASKSFRDASTSAARFKEITGSILTAGVVQRGLALVSQGIQSVTSQFIDFDKATIGATARFKDIGPEAANFEAELMKVRDAARQAGATTQYTAAQAGDALDFLARAGFTSAEAMGSLNSMINLAVASGEDFASVADWSSDLMGAFGLEASTTAQKVASLNRLNDVLVKTANSANVTVESMFETMKMAGPVSRITGTSLEEVAAMTAFLGNAGIKGTEGATALKNALLRLAAPTGEVQAALDFLNVTTDDGTGKMKKITALLGEMRTKMKGMKELDQAKVLNAIFGMRSIAGAKNIMDALEGIDAFEKTLLGAAGTSEKTAERMQKALGNRLLALSSAATEFGFKILEAFETRGEGSIDKLTEAIRNFDPSPIINGIEFTLDVFKRLWGVLSPFIPFMPWFIGMWIAYGTTMKILAIAKTVAGFIQFWGAIRKVTGSMAILNAVMTANPVGAIIVGITALIALLVLVVKHWDDIKAAFNSFVELWKIGAKIMDDAIWGVLGPIFMALEKVFQFMGIAPTAAPETSSIEANRVAPNQQEAEARGGIDFNGTLNINGAPAGSSVTSETKGARPINVALMGAN